MSHFGKVSKTIQKVAVKSRRARLSIYKIALETIKRMTQADLTLVASSLTLTTILSLVPLLAVGLAIFQTFGGMDRLYARLVPFIIKNLSEGTGEAVTTAIEGFIASAQLNTVGVWGMLGLIVTSLLLIASIDKAIHQVWQTPINRSIYHRIASYWLLVTLGPLVLGGVVGALTTSEWLGQILPQGAGIFLAGGLLFSAVFKWVPNCRVEGRYALFAGFMVSGLWGIARVGYGLYTTKVVTYSKIYGGLGAIPILLIWIYIAWLGVLFGAALSATLQQRKKP